jgi:hypothetical protein
MRRGRFGRDRRALKGLEAEIHDHLAREIEVNIARQMAPAEARRQALLRFPPALRRRSTR